MQGNRPKPTYNAARVFNSLGGHWLKVNGGDDDICAVAALDDGHQRLSVILVNYRFRFATSRKVKLAIGSLPAQFQHGRWTEFRIDSAHSNLFTDANHCELQAVDSGPVNSDELIHKFPLLPNSIVLLQLFSK
jgi:hypothetical protein